jgi:hypothetical protein
MNTVGEPCEGKPHARIGVAGTARGQSLAQPGSLAVGSGQSVVDVHPVRRNAEHGQCLSLGGEVLGVG